MKKRMALLFSGLVMLFAFILYRIFSVAMGNDLAEAAGRQSTYTLVVDRPRGKIIDCKGDYFTQCEEAYVAAVAPCNEALYALRDVLPEKDLEALMFKMSQGWPFLLRVPSPQFYAEEIEVFTVKERYLQQPVAPHVIGYLDGGGAKGVAGIEKAYDEWLSQGGRALTITYKVDALGRPLVGVEPEVRDETAGYKKGVQLTLDIDIQRICEEAAKKYLTAGAVVVMSVPDGELKAVVSLPDFSPRDVGSSLNSENSPLINRAFTQYNLGSVFKIAVAAAALEDNVLPSYQFNCTGGITVDGHYFRCHKRDGHGVVDMEKAFSESCNPYFISIAQKVGYEKLLTMAQNLGFGVYSELAPGMKTDSGLLPSVKVLRSPVGLSNFAFGQGEFMATPVQVAAMVTAVASGGEVPRPRLVQALIDEDGTAIDAYDAVPPYRAISRYTADTIKHFMMFAVEQGTGKLAKPAFGGAGGKTATAETGWKKDGRDVYQAWFAGFYPAEEPKFSIVVLAEDGKSGSVSCAPVFRDIADGLCRLYELNAVDNATSQ